MLCGLAERVRNAVRVFRMLMSRLSGACHAEVAPHRLPGGNSGIAKKEQQQHIDADAAAPAAVIVAAGVATRATCAASVLPAGPLIQKTNLPAAPAAAAGSKIGVMTLEADEVRVPREGGGPVITSRLALLWSCSRKLEQAWRSALGSRLRGRHGPSDPRP
jgi:hypothetical protein